MNIRIAFCINNLKIGGAEMLLIDLINNWPDDFDIYLILLQNTGDLANLIDERKVNKLILKENDFELYQIIDIHNYFKKYKINFCISHLERSNKFCLLASILTSTKVLPVIHNINIYNSVAKLNKLMTRYIYNIFSRKVIAISETVAEYCLNELKINTRKIIRIDNGIDFNRVKKYTENFKFNGKLNFATLGRLENVKGYDILIKALSKDKIRNLNWSLKIIGDGSERDGLKKMAEEFIVNDKVIFFGAQKFPFRHLTDVHYLIMPSRREGLPLSLLESLGFGIPVIGSNIGILPFFIKNGINGFIFNSEDELMLADIIVHLFSIADDQYIAMRSFSRKSVENYSINNSITKYLKLLNI